MKAINCYNCDEEFRVEPVYETEAAVAFCPFCGSDLDLGEEVDEELDEDIDEDSWN